MRDHFGMEKLFVDYPWTEVIFVGQRSSPYSQSFGLFQVLFIS